MEPIFFAQSGIVGLSAVAAYFSLFALSQGSDARDDLMQIILLITASYVLLGFLTGVVAKKERASWYAVLLFPPVAFAILFTLLSPSSWVWIWLGFILILLVSLVTFLISSIFFSTSSLE